MFGDKDNKNNKKRITKTIHSSISFDLIFILFLKYYFLYFQKYSINQKNIPRLRYGIKFILLLKSISG